MIAHFVGNGASKKFYNNTYGTVVVGNLSRNIHNYTACSIIDTKVILYLKQNQINLQNKNIWCTPDIVKQAKYHKIEGHWHAVYKPIYRYSSGHHAVNHLSQNKHLKIIHLWGMDSMWSVDLTSDMDDRIIRSQRPPLYKEWRPHWIQMFSKYDKRYIIHAPKGIEEIDYGQNTKYQFH